MLADLNLRFTSGLFGRAGSFWTNTFAERSHARQLVELADQNRLMVNFSRGLNRIAGRSPGSDVVAQQWLFFAPEDVFAAADTDLDDSLIRLDDEQRTTTLSAKSVRYWGIPIDQLLPLRIQAGYQQCTLGVDFFVSTNRKWLFFRRNPADLAPDGRLLVSSGLRLNASSWWSYLLNAEIPDAALPYVTAYLRNFQTPSQFRLALAAVAGLAILPATGELKQIETKGQVTVYRFEQFEVRVAYVHPALVVGKTYTKYTIVGDGVEVHQPNPARPGNDWWRAVDWRGGIVLDPIIRNAHLKLLDQLVPIYAAGSSDGGLSPRKTHARFQLSDDFWSETSYWNEVAAREKASGEYLNELVGLEADDGVAYAALLASTVEANRINDALGLPLEQPPVGALSNGKLVNPLDIMFKTVLGVKSYIVVLRPEHCPNPAALYDFLRRHLPVTGVPIVLDMGPDLPVETIGTVDSIRINDLVIVDGTSDVAVTAGRELVPLEDFLDQVFESN